jgi:hypothetical protein
MRISKAAYPLIMLLLWVQFDDVLPAISPLGQLAPIACDDDAYPLVKVERANERASRCLTLALDDLNSWTGDFSSKLAWANNLSAPVPSGSPLLPLLYVFMSLQL